MVSLKGSLGNLQKKNLLEPLFYFILFIYFIFFWGGVHII